MRATSAAHCCDRGGACFICSAAHSSGVGVVTFSRLSFGGSLVGVVRSPPSVPGRPAVSAGPSLWVVVSVVSSHVDEGGLRA